MTNLADKIKNLPPGKMDLLLRQLRPDLRTIPANNPDQRPFRLSEDHNFNLVVKRPGILESLIFQPRPRFLPDGKDQAFVLGPDDVEIEVRAASLNFRDVAVALGIYPSFPGRTAPPLGCDAAGIVTAIGRDVTRFNLRDEVVCLSGSSTFSRYARATQGQVFPKPPNMTFEQAAGLPLAFVTAYYGLTHVGRLYPGDRILIHSAAGGVGLAAIQIAKMLHAEIFATVGTEEKKEYLRSIGIQHIMDSRSLTFLQEVRDLTHGEGVDVILNSLSGTALTEGVKLLRHNGRFVELGKRDFVAGRTLDLEPFGQGLSFSVIDIRQSNKAIAPVVRELSRYFESGTLQPLPIKTFPVSKIADTFRFMTEGKHIGKFAIMMQSDPIMVEPV
jgi:NADPH:quinone reductase-like Zn-dependent oxidoreductase